MASALDSAIGLPSRSTSASWMLVFLMPLDVRRIFMVAPGVVAVRIRTSWRLSDAPGGVAGLPAGRDSLLERLQCRLLPLDEGGPGLGVTVGAGVRAPGNRHLPLVGGERLRTLGFLGARAAHGRPSTCRDVSSGSATTIPPAAQAI